MLYGILPRMTSFLERRRWLWNLLNARARRGVEGLSEQPALSSAAHRAIVVGYGPVGQTVVRLLIDRGIEPTVIEMNIEIVRRLQQAGIRAVYGDVNQHEVRETAGIRRAASLILSSSGSTSSVEAIRGAREENPDIHIVCRANYLRQAESLRKAGADEVFAGEGEVALALTDSLLRDLGGTPEQLDEFREQLRSKLLSLAKA
jgi:CPA2 family monovalent cation:H+ antiporter-2